METREYTVYKFNELTEAQKQKALDNYRYWHVEDGFWYDYIPDHIIQDIEPHGLEYISFSFSGFCSQGDGASVEYRVSDKFIFAHHLIDAWSDENRQYYFKLLKRVQRWCPGALDHNSKTEQRRGYLNYTMYYPIEFELCCGDKHPLTTHHIDQLITHLNKLSTAYHTDLEKQTYKSLEQEYEHQTSDETLSEYFEESDFMFTANGKID